MVISMDKLFYKNKVVLVTGHTGFKGTWLCKMLINFGAKVIGYSLKAPTNPNLFELSGIENNMISIIGDIRDYEHLNKIFKIYEPEIVFHLAAQPIVRHSYIEPRDTFDINVMGTVNVLECIRKTTSVKSFLNVTTDKVYFNDDNPNHPFKEDDPLDGYDPYSNSKSCSELVTHSYKKSFFQDNKCSISTARAGNVIGGGDFASDRIIPDCIRAIEKNEKIIVRNPLSTRPYQHVLEPLYIYLHIAEEQYNNPKMQGYYNVGPDECDFVNTGDLVSKFCEYWGDSINWITKQVDGPHEASFLKLDNSKIKEIFGWRPRWHIDECINKVVEWTKVYISDKKLIANEMDREIEEFLGD